MGALRKLQRSVIMNQCYQRDHHKRGFEEEWNKVHFGMTEGTDENSKKVTMKKKNKKRKQNHFDSRSLVRYINTMRSIASSMGNKNQKNVNVKEKVC